jgi:GDP-L-fucose synthase
MNIFVTGGNGFLGRCVVRRFKEAGHDVYHPRAAEFDLLGHISDPLGRFDAVVHLAAVVGGIGANMERPGEFFYKNLMMGVNLIHACMEAGVKKFVQVGTVCSYPKFCRVPFVEDSIWDGYPEETNAPYGIAKKALLVMLQAYRKQYGFNGIYLIPTNLYGPNDNDDPKSSHVIPALIRKFILAKRSGEKDVVVWGTGEATREFLYVEDAAEAIVKATEVCNSAEPVNLGSGEEVKISKLAALVSHEVGYGGGIVFDKTKPDGQPARKLSVDRASNLFGWRAATPFSVGLRDTVGWMVKKHGV